MSDKNFELVEENQELKERIQYLEVFFKLNLIETIGRIAILQRN